MTVRTICDGCDQPIGNPTADASVLITKLDFTRSKLPEFKSARSEHKLHFCETCVMVGMTAMRQREIVSGS